MAFWGLVQVFNHQSEYILGSEDILASPHNFIIKFYGKDSPKDRARYSVVRVGVKAVQKNRNGMEVNVKSSLR